MRRVPERSRASSAAMPGEHRPHRGDRVDAEVRSGAVRRDARRLDLERDEALVRDRDDLLGRLGHDRRVGRRRGGRASSVPTLPTSSSATAVTIDVAAEPVAQPRRRRRA